MVPEDEIPEGLHDVTDHDHACDDMEGMDFSGVDQYIAIKGHTIAKYNGNYTFKNIYNGRPHFGNEENGLHIYYHAEESIADSFWHIDDTPPP